MSEMIRFPECGRALCVSWHEGGCSILTDADFGGKTCPFYRTREDAEKARQKAKDRLRRMGLPETEGG